MKQRVFGVDWVKVSFFFCFSNLISSEKNDWKKIQKRMTAKAPVSGKKQHPHFDLLKSVRQMEVAKNETRPKFIPNRDLET